VTAASNTTCRPVNGLCDVAEKCSGTDNDCPADAFVTAASNTTCRAVNGLCDVAEKCSGTDNDCPTDAFVTAASNTTCRAANGVCDVAEKCSGTHNDCPADAFITAASNTTCRAANGICDVAEKCSGSDNDCPTDKFQPNTFVCNPAAQGDYCDIDEKCNGSAQCPADQRHKDGAACNQNLGTCQSDVCCPGATVLDANVGLCDLGVAGAPSQIVFVTSIDYPGDVGGSDANNPLGGADDQCNKVAQAANLKGTFTAWLSDSSSLRQGIDAISRIVGDGPFFLTDGSDVAGSQADLTDGDLKNPIHLTEWSADRNSVDVWTGTTPQGNAAGATQTCLGFSDASTDEKGLLGDSASQDGGRWTANTQLTCDTKAALYCFQNGSAVVIGKPPG
jgi:hypothetical protein